MAKRILMGIDPGAKGRVAVVSKYGQAYKLLMHVPATSVGLRHALSCYPCPEITIENPYNAVRAPSGIKATFRFGQSYGEMIGCCSGMGLEYMLIDPISWKKKFGLISSPKDQSLAVAHEFLGSDADLMATDRSRKESVDLADAVLIALSRVV